MHNRVKAAPITNYTDIIYISRNMQVQISSTVAWYSNYIII